MQNDPREWRRRDSERSLARLLRTRRPDDMIAHPVLGTVTVREAREWQRRQAAEARRNRPELA